MTLSITSLINLMTELLILLALGCIAGKLGIIDSTASKKLSKLTINFCQTAMILAAVMNVDPEMGGTDLLILVGASCLMYALFIVMSFLVPRLLRVPAADRGVYQFITIFGNVGFMGFPVIASLLGPEAVFYASLCNIPFNLLTYSLGIRLVSGGEQKTKFRLKSLVNPPFIAVGVSLIIFLFRIPIPVPIHEATSMLGDMVVPVSMLLIGATLSEMDIKEALCDWRIYVFTPIKLIIAPLLVWGILRLFITNEIILVIATTMAAMPVAANSTLLCLQYDGNDKLSAKAVFITTLVSVVTIPLIISLLLV